MFAVVRSGHRQFKVSSGDLIRVPRLSGKIQESLKLETLALEDDSGFFIRSEDLKKSSVSARILRHGLGKKILVFKKKRRKGYRRTRGHRQTFTELQIVEIKLPSGKIISAEKSKSNPVQTKKTKPPGKASKTVKSDADNKGKFLKKNKSEENSPIKSASLEKNPRAGKTTKSPVAKSGDKTKNIGQKLAQNSQKLEKTRAGKSEPSAKARKTEKGSSKKPSIDK